MRIRTVLAVLWLISPLLALETAYGLAHGLKNLMYANLCMAGMMGVGVLWILVYVMLTQK